MKDYKKTLEDDLKTKTRYNEHTRSYKNEWNGRDPILTYLTARQTRRWINIIDGGHFLGWKNIESICPHCGEKDSIEHTFTKCKCLDHKKDALAISLNGKHDVMKRVEAVQQVINIDLEREKQVMLNEIANQSDMTNKRVRLRNPGTNTWTSGTITQHINSNNNTIIELDNGHIREVNLSESVANNLC